MMSCVAAGERTGHLKHRGRHECLHGTWVGSPHDVPLGAVSSRKKPRTMSWSMHPACEVSQPETVPG